MPHCVRRRREQPDVHGEAQIHWEAYNEIQRVEKARFQVLLHELCQGVEEPTFAKGKPGVKPHTYKDSVFAMVWKVYTGFSTRRSSTDMAEADEKGYTSRLIRGAKVCQFHENPAFTPILQTLIFQSSLPLRAVETQFSIDSSGFSGCRFDRWVIEKHGQPPVESRKHTWVKAHVCVGTKTQVICAAVVKEKDSADCPEFAGLTKTTAQGGKVREMSADKAYLSAANVEAVCAAGEMPFILPKVNTTGGIGGMFEKMVHYFNYRKDEFLQHYHRRSNIETAFSMVFVLPKHRLNAKLVLLVDQHDEIVRQQLAKAFVPHGRVRLGPDAIAELPLHFRAGMSCFLSQRGYNVLQHQLTTQRG